MLTKDQHRFCVWSILVFSMGWAMVAGAEGREKANVALDADGRSFTFDVPGTMDFKGSFSATIVSGTQPCELLSALEQSVLLAGQTQVLHSAVGTLFGPVEESCEETPCGRASVSEVTLRFKKGSVDLLFRLGRIPGVPGLLAQAGIRNTGSSFVRLVSVTPVVLEGQVVGVPKEWLVTGLDMSVKEAPPVVALSEIQHPLNIFENGGFYCKDGSGFFFGPVGTPTAYVEASFAHVAEGKMTFSFASEMSGVQVQPGEMRWGQQVVLLTEPPRKALPRWAEWVGKTHRARTDKGAQSGWNSWSFHGENVSGKDVLAEVDAVLTSQGRLRPSVMEIDSGYEQGNLDDPLQTNDKFPEGLAFYARRISATGARPGIILNFEGPPGFYTIAGQIRTVVEKGFADIKINRTGLTIPLEELSVKTLFEVKREGFASLREAAGEGTYLLYNVSRPDRATVGMMDANRTGLTADRSKIRTAMDDTLRAYHLNGRWFAVDNDSYYMGTDIANVSEIAGGWPLVRTWMSMVGLSCGAAVTADPWHWESFKPLWRNVEVMTPPAKEHTEVLDLCTAREWPRLVGHVTRDWGDMTVALLWNPDAKERTVTLNFAEAGMNPRRRYAVWSFWDNRYLGVAQGSWTTPALGPSASQHLCFTDLDRAADKPVLIGSSLHIYCGAAEVKQVTRRRGLMEIELTDAGAREGDLFIYSHEQPVWKAESGCSVAEIASAGEFVWRISLVDRRSGVPQRIALGILLPVTRQIWFWVLIAFAVASLLFGAGRYVAWLNIQRENALERERARIARDLHDEIGANLSRISLIGSMLAEDMKDAGSRGELLELTDAARTTHLAFDEIVWSVNPRNDTVRSLAHYIFRYAEDFFAGSSVSCRCQLPENLLDQGIPPDQRHHIFLAVKEGLHNILKHAAATQVDIVIRLTGHILTVDVSDNGKGFSPDLVAEKGNGLRNMQERMHMAGGKVSLTSHPATGTRLCFEIPL